MHQILFEGIRCFHTYHAIPLKPITLLVGENSTGKTTFLSLVRMAWDVALGKFEYEDIFNEEPFLLGSYEQIASFRGGKFKQAKSFMLGLSIPVKLSHSGLFGDDLKITARFTSKRSESQLNEWRLECGDFKVLVKQAPTNAPDILDIIVITPRGTQKLNDWMRFRGWISYDQILLGIANFVLQKVLSKGARIDLLTEDEASWLEFLAVHISVSTNQRPYAFAPIRTRPRRTYDPVKDVPEPEGSHIPMVLAKTLIKKNEEGKALQKALADFGKASGLFSKIEVKRKGHKDSDPFQIAIKTTGPSFNLVDVGYGVSQVLPIIVDVLQNPESSTFLLQQPEVHLHPKAQAELGSFLAALAKSQNKQFVIETHSDYLIDRIRMDVRDKKFLSPDDVVILYFEKSANGVNIHQLELDEYGNLLNTPPTYRQFFLSEERRLLGM